MTARKKLLLGAGVVLLLLIAGGTVFALTRPPEDVSNPNVEFDPEPTATEVPEEIPEEPEAGPRRSIRCATSCGRTTATPRTGASSCPPPSCCARRSGASGPTPARSCSSSRRCMAEGKLFLLKNNGALHAIDKRTGKAVWKRKLGVLAASSPAYGNGRIFVTLLARGKRLPGAVYRARRRQRQDPLEAPAARRAGVLAAVRQRPHLLRHRERDGLLDARGRRRRALDVQGRGGGQGRPRAGQRQALLRRLRRPRVRDRAGRRRPGVGDRDQAAASSACAPGSFYSTPAVAYGRVYIGNTDGNVYSFASSNGKLAWTQGHRLLRLLLARRRAGAGHEADGLLRLLRRQVLRPRRALRQGALVAQLGGKISGGATVVGDIVFYSNFGRKDTTGLGARTGKTVFKIGRGAFNPVISDGRTIYLTGFSSAVRAQAADRQSRRRDRGLDLGDRVVPVVEDRGAQRGVRAGLEPSTRCCGSPTPPDAITGTSTASLRSPRQRQLVAVLVPSRSIEVSRISPAPRSTPSRAHATASRPVGVRPPAT